MRFLVALLMNLTIFTTGLDVVHADDNLFNTGKSDLSIKPFVFPKSMVVIRSCYVAGLFIEPHMSPAQDFCTQIDQTSIEKNIRKFLVKLDPARVAPAKRGKDFKDKISRSTLKAIKKLYDADIIFLFRQINLKAGGGSHTTQGLIYLTRQDKLLVVPSNNQEHSDKTDAEVDLINQKGLQQLAQDARKVIHSHKFEKRRSNY